MGGTEFDVSTPEPVADDAPATSAAKVQRTAQRMTAPILAGAKADLLTARNATKKVTQRVSSTIGKPAAATVN